MPPFRGVQTTISQGTETSAAFANIDYDLSDTFSLHGGARYTKSDTEFAGCMLDIDGNFAGGITIITQLINPGAPAAQPLGCVTVLPDRTAGDLFRSELKENNVSWRVGLDWKPVSGTLLFGTVSRGYKSGSYPTINATTFASLLPVTQESVTAYEVGFKTDFGSPRVQVNGAAFFYDYQDKQMRGRIVDPLGVFGAVEALVNVPKSRVMGAELSLLTEPVDGLVLNLSATYLDTKVTEDFNNYNPFGSRANFKNEPFPFTPEWSAQAGVEYTWSLGASLNAFVGGNVSYRTDTTSAFGRYAPTTLYPYSLVEIDGYSLVDLQAGIADATGDWRVTLWGRNVGDTYYWTDAFRQIDNTSRHVGDPQRYGIRVSYNW